MVCPICKAELKKQWDGIFIPSPKLKREPMKDMNDFLGAHRRKKILLFLAGLVVIIGGITAYEKSIVGAEWKSPTLPRWVKDPAGYKRNYEKKHPGKIVEISKNELPFGWKVKTCKTCNRALEETMGQHDEFGLEFFGQTPWTKQRWKHDAHGVLVPAPNVTHLVYLGKKTWVGLHHQLYREKKITKVCMLIFEIENGPEKLGEKVVTERSVIGSPNMILLKEREVINQKNGQPKIETLFYKFDANDQLNSVHENFLGQTDFHVKPIPLPSIPGMNGMGGPR